MAAAASATLDRGFSPNPSELQLLSTLPALDDTYGALLLGCYTGLISYGVLIHQAYRYARTSANDSAVTKSYVFAVMVLDTVHNIVCMHACYAYLVTNYFKPVALLSGIWSIQIQPLLAGLAVLICQSFFARRVYLIDNKHRILVAFSVLLTFVTSGLAVAGTVIAFELHTFAQYQHFYWIDSAACGAAIASDLLTASVLVNSLRRSRTGFKPTDALLNTLIAYTINTGLLTGIVNTLALVFALVRPNTMIWIALEIVAVRLYTNSVLAVLNSRESLKTAKERASPLQLELELQCVPKTGTHASSQIGSQDVTTSKKSDLRQWDNDLAIPVSGDRQLSQV